MVNFNALFKYFIFRNAKKELNDIRFEFAVGKDSAEGIASELVGAGLVDSRDSVVITNNLQKLIDSRYSIKLVTFPLVSFLHPVSFKIDLCDFLEFGFSRGTRR